MQANALASVVRTDRFGGIGRLCAPQGRDRADEQIDRIEFRVSQVRYRREPRAQRLSATCCVPFRTSPGDVDQPFRENARSGRIGARSKNHELGRSQPTEYVRRPTRIPERACERSCAPWRDRFGRA